MNDHALSTDCWCSPTRERWDDTSQQWVPVTGNSTGPHLHFEETA